MAVASEKEGSFLSLCLSRRKATDGGVASLNELIYSTLYWRFQTQGCVAKSSPIHGSIFNIEFSPSDSIVLTACSNNSVIAYDPRLCPSRPVRSVRNAHSDCTNCITFMDDSTFLSCSDDRTIHLWDLRNLSSCVCTLFGHTNWVKNIEYDRKSSKIFSVAFHDGVREWSLKDLNDGTCEKTDNIVFKLDDPVRMRIAPDGSKMFVTMRMNRCLVIDNFDGATVKDIKAEVESLVSRCPFDRRQISYSDRDVNRPSALIMSGLKHTKNSYRSVMSASFHPSSEMIALRHVDVKNNHLQQELSTLFDLRAPPKSHLVPVGDTTERYLKYSDEFSPDDSLDYIKECSFSPDGRILASPHATISSLAHGVRFLAVDSKCTPMETYYDSRFFSSEKASGCYDFEVVGSLFGHRNPVLACAFAHHDMMLGTGSMEGHVLFHRPQL